MRFKFLLTLIIALGLTAIASGTMRPIAYCAVAAQSGPASSLSNGLSNDLSNGRFTLNATGSPRKSTEKQNSYDSRESSDEFRWSGHVSPGRAVEIKGVNGGIKADGAPGGEIEVIADKHGRRSDAREVRIQVIEHSDGVTICAVYPSTDASRPNVCEPGPSSHMHIRNNDVSVDFTVHVPAGVRFIGRTVNGGVHAESIGSDVEAHTVNGGIRISASGHAQATTVNGSITASLGNAQWTGSAEFKTVNGSITLNLPSDVNTDLHAETLNGDISTDFPLTVQGRIDRRHVSGSLGSGGRQLFLKTVNGSIRLRRGIS